MEDVKAYELRDRHIGRTATWVVATDDEPDTTQAVTIAALRTHRVTGSVEITDTGGQVAFLPTDWPVEVS